MVDPGAPGLDVPVLAVTLLVGAAVLLVLYVSNLVRGAASASREEAKPAAKGGQSRAAPPGRKEKPPAEQKGGKKRRELPQRQQYTHPWLLTSLKEHTGQILAMDLSANGKFLATCADDRAVVIWQTRDWPQKEHKHLRMNVPLDHATHVCWSPDSKALVLRRAGDNALQVLRLAKRPDGLLGPAPAAFAQPTLYTGLHEESVVSVGVASSGRFLLSCSEDNALLLSNLRGQPLARVDTLQVRTHAARISPCARFVAAAGFTPDVKVWEVEFTKTGEFKSVVRAFELTGHTSGIFDIAFNSDSTRVATVSKDASWKLYDINVEYKKGESPRLLMSRPYHLPAGTTSHIALSPLGDVVVVAAGSDLHFFIARTGELDRTIENIYPGPISGVMFDSSGKHVLTAGLRHVRVFHNVAGAREAAAMLRQRLHPSLSSAHLERVRQQLAEAEAFLASVGEPVAN